MTLVLCFKVWKLYLRGIAKSVGILWLLAAKMRMKLDNYLPKMEPEQSKLARV